MIYFAFFAAFLLGGAVPFVGEVLCKKLPPDPGSLVILVWKQVRKRKSTFSFSWTYAALTVLFAVFFAIKSTFAMSLLSFFFVAVIPFSLSLLVYSDLKHYLLPDALTLPLLLTGFYFSPLLSLPASLAGAAWGFMLSSVIGFVSSIKKPDAFGGGDMKLMMAFGAFVGVQGLSALILFSLPFFVISYFLTGRKYIPYGPSLITAFFILLAVRDYCAFC